MRVDIYIREIGSKREIRIPILPEDVPLESGAATFASSEIMRRGEVAVPTGTELATYPWESEFPGALRKNDPMIRGSWKDPKTYHTILEDWKNRGAKLNLVVIGYPYINADVYLRTYQPTLTGPYGDISYKVEFVEARDITIKTTKVPTPKRPSSSDGKYTIKPGDTLWGISKKFYGTGTKWKTIYNANKDIIEKTAKARWKAAGINRDSQNGHWIFPGVTLTIPGVGNSSTGATPSTTPTSKPKTSVETKNKLSKTKFGQFITKFTGEKATSKVPDWYKGIVDDED